MKRIIICLFFFLFAYNANSQFIALKVNLADCSKSKYMIENYLLDSKIPYFYIFDLHSISDKELIHSRINENDTNKIIFTDKYHQEINLKTSSFSYINKNGKIVFSENIYKIDKNIIDSIKGLYDSEKSYANNSIIESFRDGWHIKNNLFTSSILYDSAQYSYKVIINDSIFQKIVSSIKMSEPQFYSLTEQAIEENSLSKNAVMVNVTNHYFSKGRMFLLVEVPYVHPPTKKEIENGIKGSIQKKYVVMQQKNGINEKIYSLDIDNGDYQILPTAFMANGIEEFYFIHIPKENKDFKDKRFLAKYKIEDNKLVFDKKLSVHYPEFFFKSGIGYSLSPIFLYSFYPYLVQMSGNKVYNLSSDTELEFSYSLVSDIKDIDSTYIEQLHQGASFPITNLYVFPVNNNKFGLITRIEKVDYLYVFSDNEGIMKELYKIKLSDKGVYLSEYPVFNIDKKKEYFYYQDNNKIMRGLPLDFLIN